MPGVVRGGVWSAGSLTLPAPACADGEAVLVCRPSQVRAAETGWRTRVVRVEQTLGGVLLSTADPALAWEVPFDVWARHPLAPGAEVALAIDPAAARFLRP